MKKQIIRFIYFVLISFISVKASIGLSAPICSQVFNKSYLFFLEQHLNSRVPKVQTENSKNHLMDSVTAILEQYSIRFEDVSKNKPENNIAHSFFFKGRTLYLNPSLPRQYLDVPLDGVWAIGAAVTESLTQVGLDFASSRELALRAQRAVIEDLGLNWTDFAQTSLKQFDLSFDRATGLGIQLKNSVENLARLIEIDSTHDIPYLAGYAQHTARMIFFDRDFRPLRVLSNGRTVDLTHFLMVHEVVEKALIDFLKLDQREYYRTHQIAQRIEKAFVEAHGIQWTLYQHKWMREEIEQSGTKEPEKIPYILDLTPYRDQDSLNDYKMVVSERVRPSKASKADIKKPYVLKEVMPGVFHLNYADQRALAKTMMRFQEHFESPEFKQKIFLRKEFKDWYKSKKGKFDYYENWDGFNFPNYVLEPFYRGQFKNLTAGEKQILELFKLRRHAKIYIIATADNSGEFTFHHEIAHALYYFNAQYRSEIDKLMSHYNIEPVKKHLYEVEGDYHRDVLHDEAHAWLMHDSSWLVKSGFDIRPYDTLIAELVAIYQKYTLGLQL